MVEIFERLRDVGATLYFGNGLWILMCECTEIVQFSKNRMSQISADVGNNFSSPRYSVNGISRCEIPSVIGGVLNYRLVSEYLVYSIKRICI